MKIFREYLTELKELADKHPESLDFQVLYSSDDEGNDFRNAIYSPSIGRFEDDEWDGDSENPNCVCLN